MAFIKRKIDWTAPVTISGTGLEMTPELNPYVAEVEANSGDARSWTIKFTQGEDTGKEVDVLVSQPAVYRHSICYYDKEGTTDSMHTSGATIILCADMSGRVKIGQGVISEDGCCEIISTQSSAYAFACGAREWSEFGDEIWVSDGTDEGKHRIYGETIDSAEYPLYDFEECELIRKITEDATYDGSLNVWARSKEYINTFGPIATNANEECVFYMTESENKEECEILSITPEASYAGDINNFYWNYEISGVDETSEPMDDYIVTVCPKSESGITGTFTLTHPYKQNLTVNSNVGVGTTVSFYIGTTGSNGIDEQPIVDSSAMTTVVGCEEKINETEFKVKVNYTPKVIDTPSSSTTFSAQPTIADFNYNKTVVNGEQGQTAVTINIESTSSTTAGLKEVWVLDSNGVGKLNADNSFETTISIEEVPYGESSGPTNCGYRVENVKDNSEPEPEVNVHVIFLDKSGHTITSLTVPNSVESNNDSMEYFTVAHLVNGVRHIEDQSHYNIVFNNDITKNEAIESQKYIVGASISGKSSSLELFVEGSNEYDIFVKSILRLDYNGRFMDIDRPWKLVLTCNERENIGEIMPNGLVYQNGAYEYELEDVSLKPVIISVGDTFTLDVIDSDGVKPIIHFQGEEPEQANLSSFDVKLYNMEDETCENDLIGTSVGNSFTLGTPPTSRFLKMALVIYYNALS